MHQTLLWYVAQNYKIDFDDIWQKYSEDFQISSKLILIIFS